MSRYQLISKIPRTAVVVGWDAPLQTYFAQVRAGGSRETDEPTVPLWIGTTSGECRSIAALRSTIAPWADLPQGTAEALEREQLVSPSPTPLQAQCLAAFVDHHRTDR